MRIIKVMFRMSRRCTWNGHCWQHDVVDYSCCYHWRHLRSFYRSGKDYNEMQSSLWTACKTRLKPDCGPRIKGLRVLIARGLMCLFKDDIVYMRQTTIKILLKDHEHAPFWENLLYNHPKVFVYWIYVRRSEHDKEIYPSFVISFWIKNQQT